MNTFWTGFTKRADECKELLKKHEERETPEQEAKETPEEQAAEKKLGIHDKKLPH